MALRRQDPLLRLRRRHAQHLGHECHGNAPQHQAGELRRGPHLATVRARWGGNQGPEGSKTGKDEVIAAHFSFVLVCFVTIIFSRSNVRPGSLPKKSNIWHFLQKMPMLSKVYSTKMDSLDETADCQKLYDNAPASILVAGVKNGRKLTYGIIYILRLRISNSFFFNKWTTLYNPRYIGACGSLHYLIIMCEIMDFFIVVRERSSTPGFFWQLLVFYFFGIQTSLKKIKWRPS